MTNLIFTQVWLDNHQAAAFTSFIKNHLSLEYKTRTPSIFILTQRRLLSRYSLSSYSLKLRLNRFLSPTYPQPCVPGRNFTPHLLMCPYSDSNGDFNLRRVALCPLSYRDIEEMNSLPAPEQKLGGRRRKSIFFALKQENLFYSYQINIAIFCPRSF